ncbi:MAG: YdcH family protein [Edaphobacter sp.]
MQTAKFTELPQPSSLPSIHQLMQEHSLYARRLETLRAKIRLTATEEMEEIRLKKIKLRLKDEMERLRRLGVSFPQG